MAQFAIDEILTTGIQISGFIFDVNNSIGPSGYVLTTTPSGVMWKLDPSSEEIQATGTLLNNRINSLSGYVNNTFLSGSGIQNYVPRWNTSKELVTGSIYDLGTGVGIGTTRPVSLLTVGAAGSTSAANGISFGGDVSSNIYRDSNASIRTDGGFLAASRIRSLDYIQFNTNLYPNAFTNYIDINIGNLAANNWQSAIRINPGGYVGIGTTQPSGKLHIVSSVIGETVLRADGTNGTLFSVVDDLSDSLMSVNNSAGLPVFEVFADDRIVAGQYGSGDFILQNNKIGIGVTNPGEKLDVNGNVRIGLTTTNTIGTSNTFSLQTRAINIQANSSTDTLYIRYLNDGNYQLQTATLGANGGNLHLQPYGGDVGIGVTQPGGRLHISGSNGHVLYLNQGVTGAQGGLYLQNVDQFALSSARLYFISGDSILFTRGPSNLAWAVSQNANVGIGVTNPSEKLTITGAVKILTRDGANFKVGDGSNNSTFLEFDYPDITTSGAYFRIFRNTNTKGGKYFQIFKGDGTAVTQTLLNASGDSHINAVAGNVGVGTDGPSYKLDVIGTVRASGELISEGNNARLSLFRLGGINYFDWASGQSLYFSTESSVGGAGRNTVMSITSGGNVGVGTVNALAPIHIGGNASSNDPWMLLDINDTYFKRIIFSEERPAYGVTGYGGYIGYDANNNTVSLGTYHNTGEYRSINIKRENGNVGIGTTVTPLKLNVSGSIYMAAGSGSAISWANDISSQFLKYDSVTDGMVLSSWAHTTFLTQQTERVRIASNGNVGIATTNPGYSLQIGQSSSGNNIDYSLGILRHGTLTYPGSWTSTPALKIIDTADGGPSNVDIYGLINLELPRFQASDTNAEKASLFIISFDTALGPFRIDGKGNHWIGYDRVTTGINNSSFSSLIYGGLAVGDTYQTTTLSNGQAIFQGNVGIGVTNPGVKLQVVNTGAATSTSTVRIVGSTGNGAGPQIEFFKGASQKFSIGTASAITGGFSDDLLLTTLNPSSIILTAGLSGLAIFKTDGKVGIGVYNPISLLSIGGAGSTLAASGLTFGQDDQANLYRSAEDTIKTDGNLNVVGTATLGPVNINGGTLGASPVNISLTGFNYAVNNGNVSQITFVEKRFAVGGDWTTATTRIQKRVDVTDQAYIEFNPSGALYGMALGVAAGGSLEAMRILSNGNIGIATTNPSQKLEVQGNIQIGNDSVNNVGLKLNRLNGGIRTSEHTYHSANNSPWYTYGQNLTWTNELAGTVEPTQAYRPYFEGFTPAGGYKVFGFMNVATGSFTSSNLINALVITNDGKVGIGTVGPSSLLDVSGVVRFDSLGAAETRSVVSQGGQRIFMPSGGVKFLGNSSTGAIRIKSPVNGSSDSMHTIKGTVFEYATGKTFQFVVSFYYYNNQVLQPTAQIIGGPNASVNRNFTVRVGRDSNSAFLIYIGELADTWNYGYVYITEVFFGWSMAQANLNAYQTGWSISTEASAFENVMATIADTQITNWSRNGSSTYYNLGTVGIGTASQVGKLDVYDDANAGHVSFVRNANTGANAYSAFVLRRDGNNNGIVLFTNSSNRSTDGGAGNSTLRTDNGNLNFGAGGSQHILTTAGNVGINNTSPTSKLHVVEATATGTRIQLGTNTENASMNAGLTNDLLILNAPYGTNSATISNSGAKWGIKFIGTLEANQFNSTTKTSAIYAVSEDPTAGYNRGTSLAFYTNAWFDKVYEERMRIFHNGNIGIGTTQPSQKLQIVGSGTVASPTVLQVAGLNDAGGDAKLIVSQSPVASDLQLLAAGTDVRSDGFTANDQYILAGQQLNIFNRGNGSTYNTQIAVGRDGGYGNISFSTAPQNQSAIIRMYITSGGNVGIGTSNPVELLDLYGSASRIKFHRGGSYDMSFGMHDSTYSALSIKNASDASTIAYFQYDGNVGIGTTNPNGNYGKLTVAGGIRTVDDNNSKLELGRYSTGVPNSYIKLGTNSSALHITNAADNADLFTITNSGNVGIGSTTPRYKLDVNSSIVSRSTLSSPRFSSAGTYVYGVTNNPVWNQSCGSAVNNNAIAPDGTTTAGTYTLTSTCGSYDVFQTIAGLTVGRVYTIGMWVKLGTATNFCLVVNNTVAWNTIGGKAFDSSDGLSTGKWTHISYTFSQPGGSNQINLHLGYHAETAVAQQTAGTVFIWNIEMTEFSSTWIGNVEDEIRLPGSSIWTSRGSVGVGQTNPLSKFVVSGGTVNTTTYTTSEARISDGSLHLMKTVAGGIFESIRAMNNDTTIGTTVRVLAASTSDPFNNGNGGKVFIDAIRTSTNMDLAFSLNDVGGAAPLERVRFMGNGSVGIGTSVTTGLLNVVRNTNTAQPIALFKEQYGSPAATNVLLLERLNNLSAANQVSSNAGLRIRDHASNYSLSVEDHNSNVNFAISGARVMLGSRGTDSLLNIGGVSSTLPASGITFGQDPQVNLYRIAEDVLRTDANLNVLGYVSVGGYIYTSAYIQVAQGNIYPGGYTSDLNLNIGNTAGNTWETAIKIKPGSYVGIGTAQPSGKLHVVSTVAGETVLRADGTNGTLFSVVDDLSDSLMSVNNSAGLPVLEVFADDRVVAGQYGSGDFVIRNNKVGIGTTNPINKLSVIGGASIGSNSYNVATPSNGLIIEGNVGIGTTNPSTYASKLAIETSLNRGLMVFNPSLADTSTLFGLGFGYALSNYNSAYIGFYKAGNSSTSNRLSFSLWNQDNILNINGAGNVGIGTTDPQYKLDVYSANQDTARFYNNQTNFGLLLGSINNTSYTNLVWTTSNGNAQFFKNRSSTSWGGADSMNLYTSNGGIAFHPAGTQNAVFFATNGNVGIGTTVPTNTLQVVGQIAIKGNESADNAKIYIQASDNSNRYTIETDLDGNTNNDLLIFRSNTADNMLVLKGDGNIGINTTNPADKIHISGGGISFTSSTGLAIPMLGVTATNVAYVGPYTTTAEGVSPSLVLFNQGASVQQTWFYSSGRVAMVLNKEGRLHIGNTNNTPNCLLSVGPTSATTAVSGMCFGNDASANWYRSAASTIKTDGNLVVAGTATLNGNLYGQKTVTLSTASWTTVLTVNMLAHTSCYVKIGAFGDWGNHSAVAFVSELFIQNGDNAGYGEPGTIISAYDNTRGAAGDKIDIQIVDPAAAGTQNFLIQLKLISATSSTNSSLITYHVMGQQASVT